VSDGGTDWEDEEESPERPFGTKPFGTKPFGTKPFGTKPFGTKPFGTKPFGTKAAGGGSLDPAEWGADIAQLVCESSPLIRLGATLVASEPGGSLPAPVFDVTAEFRAPGAREPAPKKGGAAPADIRPGEWRLSAAVTVSTRVLDAVVANPEVAYILKMNLAEALARRADEAFLRGRGPGHGELEGIAVRLKAAQSRDDHLKTARAMVGDVRGKTHGFRSPGWIFSPLTLDELTTLCTVDGLSESNGGRTLDSYDLLQLDGVDGGVFLGFPFLISAAAADCIFFASDWQEAWIGLEEYFVSVSAEPASGDQIVLKAFMPLDFALRTTDGFAASRTPRRSM
jgi:HK97 family phage major capsid protein